MSTITALKEDFLHFVWKNGLFHHGNLQLTNGETIEIVQRGHHNHDAGPDFEGARIRSNGLEWVGNVEIHRYAADWYAHQHQDNPNYDNVILHVVYENNKEVMRSDNSVIPCLELKGRIKPEVIHRYQYLTDHPDDIACASGFDEINRMVRLQTLDRMIIDRLEEKSSAILQLVAENGGDWRETSYQLIAQALGYKVNSEEMKQLAQKVPYKILCKHRDHLIQLEALLFGGAAMIPDSIEDEYTTVLYKEFNFLKGKYGLSSMEPQVWKFSKMRPANFPTIRIAQLSALVHQFDDLYATFTALPDIEEFNMLLSIEQSNYWQQHTHFGSKSKERFQSLGQETKNRILINVVVPLIFASGVHFNKQELKDRAISFLEKLPAEVNKVTKKWKYLELSVQSALDSQACIQLMNQYCQKRRCLECNIGMDILTRR